MHLEFEKNVRKDTKKLPAHVRTKLKMVFDDKKTFPPKQNIKPLKGCEPWLRLRIGSFRVLLRPLNKDELIKLKVKDKRGYLISRVIHRKDLEKQVNRLK